MRDLGLGYEQISALNPGIIYTSITPFGQSGPYARYKTTDMVLWAMGGALYVCGDGDRPPARVSVPQAEHQGGAQGAAGSMIALFARHATGEGQHVDVSIQAAVIRVLMNAAANSILMGVNIERGGGTKRFPDFTVRDVFPTLDGYIAGTMSGGNVAWRSTEALIRWMDSEGKASDFLKSRDWRNMDYFKIMTVGGELAREFERCQDEFAAFFATKTKAEIYAHAGQRQDAHRPGQQHAGPAGERAPRLPRVLAGRPPPRHGRDLRRPRPLHQDERDAQSSTSAPPPSSASTTPKSSPTSASPRPNSNASKKPASSNSRPTM